MLVLSIAFALYLANNLCTLGFKHTNPSTLAIFAYIAIPLGYLIDVVAFGVRPGPLEILGGSIILTVNVTVAYLKYKKYIE